MQLVVVFAQEVLGADEAALKSSRTMNVPVPVNGSRT